MNTGIAVFTTGSEDGFDVAAEIGIVRTGYARDPSAAACAGCSGAARLNRRPASGAEGGGSVRHAFFHLRKDLFAFVPGLSGLFHHLGKRRVAQQDGGVVGQTLGFHIG